MDEFELDSSEFNRACEQVIAQSEKTYPDFINGRLLAVAIKASDSTKEASRDIIARQMGQVATEAFSKTGKRLKRTRRVYRSDISNGGIAGRIINARRKKQGQPLIWGEALEAAARKMIAARLRAVGFIRSGWVYAQRSLAKAVYGASYRPSKPLARMSGQAKGGALPAQFALSSVAEGQIFNSALLQNSSQNPMAVARDGLRLALDTEQAEMLDHLQKKLQPVMDKHSA